ncbi:unnamed protein product [Schistocephalus solidus]|uniref:Ubiquitin-like domain-containing protein n=1 Tax=Schistocephalus solidus TaxID=70667 RepID=A0A183SC54_SCHSO|nr:unnamed protein product [Schistocephalus solidus]
MLINIVYRKADKISVSVAENEKVGQLKDKIWEIGRIPKVEQLLTFDGYFLEDAFPLSDYGIEANSTITVNLRRGYYPTFKVDLILPNGTTLTLTVAKTDTVAGLKDHLQKTAGLVSCSHEVMFNGYLLQHMGRELLSYGIKDASTLKVIRCFPVEEKCRLVVKLIGGKELKLETHNDCPIQELRSVIAKETGVKMENMLLLYNGRELRPPETLAYYEIQREATISMLHSARDD